MVGARHHNKILCKLAKNKSTADTIVIVEYLHIYGLSDETKLTRFTNPASHYVLLVAMGIMNQKVYRKTSYLGFHFYLNMTQPQTNQKYKSILKKLSLLDLLQ